MRIIITILVSFVIFSNGAFDNGHEFNYKNIITAAIKVKKDINHEKLSTTYLALFKPKKYQKNSDDEFAIRKLKKKAVPMMKRKLKNFDLTKDFSVPLQMTFGEYNFDKQVFNLKGIDKNTYVSVKPDNNTNHGKLSGIVRIFFDNYEISKQIKMNKDHARKLVQKFENKSRGRSVVGVVHFEVRNIKKWNIYKKMPKDMKYQERYAYNHEDVGLKEKGIYIGAKITKIEIYHSKQRKNKISEL